MSLDDSILLEDDGLYMPEVGFWSKIKHQKVGYYCDLFASSMKRKWDYRVYIDLFASAGKCRVKNTNEVILGSPLLAMSVGAPFDKYVFCEEEPVSMDALKKRVQLYFNDKRCAFISGNTNENAKKVIDTLPVFD
ncbi:MAG: three-Cys-motif partner protein TcmP, partial [Chlorobiales bacterium]|nr:three-Cys-motif partner protein TcmP [Chlorobiales bacterium]